jgi:AcrR family transcriptional regulator
MGKRQPLPELRLETPSNAAPAHRVRLGGRSARIRTAVLEKAFEVLIEKGLDAFTIAQVATRAGVHETSIYRRWGTPTALALDACLGFADEVLAIPDTGSLRSDLFELLSRVSNLLRSPRGRALLALSVALDPQSVAARKEYWRTRLATASQVIERAVARGEIPTDTNAMEFLETLIAPLYFRALVTGEPIETWPIEANIDRMIAGTRFLGRSP